MPPEKERKRLVLVISCIGLTMTFMAAVMVGITLGLSHVIEEQVIRKYFYFTHTVEPRNSAYLDNQEKIQRHCSDLMPKLF